MAMKVTLFGQLKEMAADGVVDAPSFSDTLALRRWLEEQFPMLSSLPYVLAIDKKIMSENSPLLAGQEVAVLPPYSGG